MEKQKPINEKNSKEPEVPIMLLKLEIWAGEMGSVSKRLDL